MTISKIGFLHPGAMGISLAASAINSGFTACWASVGRSKQTIERAKEHNLSDLESLQNLCDECELIVSICPPHAAVDVAQAVINCGFKGIFVDANAISSQRALEINQMMQSAGIDFVDGSVIGGPAWKENTTWLYLSGKSAKRVADCFSSGPLLTEIIGEDPGKASALKMCFSANSKGTTALLCAVVAAAEKLGVRDVLENQWDRYNPGYSEATQNRISKVTAKAWRFSGEMNEIARTLESAGLPGGFHFAAEDVYERIAGFKDADDFPPVDDVLAVLIDPKSNKEC